MTTTGDHNASEEFLNAWEDLSSEERLWTFQMLVTLQPRACVVHCDGCILAANESFGQYLKADACKLIGCNLQQYIPMSMLHVVQARAYDENIQPYPLVARLGRALQLVDIEPHVVHLNGHVMRLLFVKPLARLQRIKWLAKMGGGVAAST